MDELALAGALLSCVALTLASIVGGSQWRPGTPPTAPWCLPDQKPAFSFGFAELNHDLGAVMGQPIECEHGVPSSGDTLQRTTTGVALYQWCLNTSTFTRGPDHWTGVPGGIVHWTDADPPPEVPIVRAPDLRSPCPPG
jgi:hypothetical protein